MADLERLLGDYGKQADDQARAVTVSEVRARVLSGGSPESGAEAVGPQAQAAPATPDADDDLVIDLDEERGRRGGRGRRVVWAAAAAAAVVLVVVVVLQAGDGNDETDIVNQPEEVGLPESDGSAPATSTTTTTVVIDPWAFDITYIDVDAGHAVAANEDYAWVAGTAAPVLSTIDLATNEVVSTSAIPAGAGTANFGFGSVWINHDDGWVTRFDPETDTIVARIEVGGQPSWIEPGVDSMWLGTGPGQQAVRIDPATSMVTATIDVGGGRAGAVAQNASGVWVGGTGQLTRIDPATDTAVATIDVPGVSGGLMVSPEAVWMPGGITGVVHRIDPQTNNVGATIDLGVAVGETVWTRGMHYAGGTLWTRYSFDCVEGECNREGVARIDPATNEVVATSALREGWEPAGMSAGPTTAWTSNEDAVVRFDFR